MTLSFQSEVGVLKKVVMKHPQDAFQGDARIDSEWRRLNYLDRPDGPETEREFVELTRLLQKFEVEVLTLPPTDAVGLDSIYTRDASIVTDSGVILCNMGKKERREEPSAQNNFYIDCGTPVLGRIEGSGTLEGGDVTWLRRNTLVVGLGYRTNHEGIEQLSTLLGPEIDVITVPMPHFRGPEDVLHLMSILSLVDDDLAVVYSPLMPVYFRKFLIEKGFDLVDIAEEEYDSQACNILAVAPRVCVMAEGSPKTYEKLRNKGVQVESFSGSELCFKGSGGPTCLTRTLEREV